MTGRCCARCRTPYWCAMTWCACHDPTDDGDEAEALARREDKIMEPKQKTYWNGMETPARRGTAVVADDPAFPMYWACDLVGQRVPVVEVILDGVNHGGGIDYLDNRDGAGWLKVTELRGSGRYGHASVAIVEGSFEAVADQ